MHAEECPERRESPEMPELCLSPGHGIEVSESEGDEPTRIIALTPASAHPMSRVLAGS